MATLDGNFAFWLGVLKRRTRLFITIAAICFSIGLLVRVAQRRDSQHFAKALVRFAQLGDKRQYFTPYAVRDEFEKAMEQIVPDQKSVELYAVSPKKGADTGLFEIIVSGKSPNLVIDTLHKAIKIVLSGQSKAYEGEREQLQRLRKEITPVHTALGELLNRQKKNLHRLGQQALAYSQLKDLEYRLADRLSEAQSWPHQVLLAPLLIKSPGVLPWPIYLSLLLLFSLTVSALAAILTEAAQASTWIFSRPAPTRT